MFKYFLGFLILNLTASQAATVTVSCALAPKSAAHLFTDIVANCGANTTEFPETGYAVILGQITNVSAEDLSVLKSASLAWIKANASGFKDLKLTLSSAQTAGNRLSVQDEYITSDFYKLRDSYQHAITHIKTPSGTNYQLQSNSKGYFVGSIPVATTPVGSDAAVDIIKKRLRQNDSIYSNDYFEIALGQPQLIIR